MQRGKPRKEDYVFHIDMRFLYDLKNEDPHDINQNIFPFDIFGQECCLHPRKVFVPLLLTSIFFSLWLKSFKMRQKYANVVNAF